MQEAIDDMARGRKSRAPAGGVAKLERVLAQATALARDGYLSRASSALEGMDPCAPDEACFQTLQGLYPTPCGTEDARAEGLAHQGVALGMDSVAYAAQHSKRAAAGYLQPLHLKCIATDKLNLDPLVHVLNRVLTCALPPRAQALLYDHKLFALNKDSKHQQDLEARVRAAMGDGIHAARKIRPVAIGDALLRLAERAACHQLKGMLRGHLMPHQVGVAVPGGLGMWSTVVEAMLQADRLAVLLSIDLTNCFNACDRDMLIRECLRYEELRPLARYVAGTYPPGTVAWARLHKDWQ